MHISDHFSTGSAAKSKHCWQTLLVRPSKNQKERLARSRRIRQVIYPIRSRDCRSSVSSVSSGLFSLFSQSDSIRTRFPHLSLLRSPAPLFFLALHQRTSQSTPYYYFLHYIPTRVLLPFLVHLIEFSPPNISIPFFPSRFEHIFFSTSSTSRLGTISPHVLPNFLLNIALTHLAIKPQVLTYFDALN